jgi:hypothetical protein
MAGMNDRTRSPSELQMPGDEVRMQVGLNDVRDSDSRCLSVVQVLLDVSLRIDNGHLASIADHVRGVC